MSEEKADYIVAEEQRRAETLLTRKLAAMIDADKDQVNIPKIYIDMTGDWRPAAVLDEIMFWTKPKRSTGKTSLRVKRGGVLWFAVRREEWWDRKRLTERQSDRAIDKLIELDLVEKDVFNFNGKPTVHLRLKAQNFAKLYIEKVQERVAEMADDDEETVEKDLSDLYEMMGFPSNLPNGNLPNGEFINLPNGEFINLPNGEFINSPHQPPETTPHETEKFDKTQADITWLIGHDQKPTDKQIAKQQAAKAFEDMLESEFLRLRLNWIAFDEKAKERFRRFIQKEIPPDQTLSRFVSWWNTDPARAANPPYTLAIVMQRWPQAFTGASVQPKNRPTMRRE